MIKGLVSVVVPVYNVEQYLDRCIESIIAQTYTNLEIILIDDGSTDNSSQLCDKWAKKDNRIKVVHKNNEGLGMARNTGIENSSGEYICFFDSDDYVSLFTIEKCIDSARKYNSDVVMFGFNYISNTGDNKSYFIPSTDKEFYHDDEIMNFVLPNMIGSDTKNGKKSGLNMSACASLFSSALIKNYNLRFISERECISEDYYFLLGAYKYVKRFSVIREGFYKYCYNGASLTHIYDPNRYYRICACHKMMLALCEKNRYSQQIIDCVHSQYFGSVLGAMKLIINSSEARDKKRKLLSEIINDDYINNVVTKMNLKNETISRKIVLQLVKNKMTVMVYILVKLKS